jgi:predicted nucleic acid-binding protein
MPELIIADSSALIALEKIRLSDILCKMYSEVLLPEAVIEEYGIPDFPCVSVRKVDDNLKSLLSHYANLGKGESVP